MTAPRAGLIGVALVAAVVLQTALVARLALPYGRPDLILLIVVAIALVTGPTTGMVAGFSGGLLADLLSDHPAGLLALLLCLLGYVSGLVRDAARRSVLLPLSVVAGAAIASTVGFAALLGLIGNPRLDWQVVGASLPATVTYDVILAAFVVPTVAAAHRRLNPRES